MLVELSREAQRNFDFLAQRVKKQNDLFARSAENFNGAYYCLQRRGPYYFLHRREVGTQDTGLRLAPRAEVAFGVRGKKHGHWTSTGA